MTPRHFGPFVLPVRDILRKPGEMREHSLSLTAPQRWGEGIVAVEEGTPLQVEARLESVHEGILVSAEIETAYRGECSRCLREIDRALQVEFQELFEYPGSEAADYEVQDDHVDLETPVRDVIVLSLPFQPVCQPDCPGLDPVTGERLTEDAGATRQVPVDPRWAALQEFTDRSAGAVPAPGTEES